jgi:lipopolysaccharide export system permease protein
MNKVIYNYLIFNYLKIIGNFILVFLSLGIVLNLFEEIEFFKNLDVNVSLPLFLTLLFVPNTILKLIPFIIFLSSMWYFVSLNNKKEILTLKTYGVSSFKIIMTLSITAFLFGVFIILAINPVTSVMVKSYENIKSNHSSYIDHLVSINKNGVWIKENNFNQRRIINAKKIDNNNLIDATILILDSNNNIEKRLESKIIDISKNNWLLKDTNVFENKNDDSGVFTLIFEEELTIKSMYNADKIYSAYKNLDTISFWELITEYEKLKDRGYPQKFLNEKINIFISLPFFLLLMVVLSSILAMHQNAKTQNIYYIFVSILVCVIVFYFKDLSVALGQTGRIPLEISVWMPIIAIFLFCSIGVLSVNEK